MPERAAGWPARLGPVPAAAGAIALRPLRRRDGTAWRAIRLRDREQLQRWEATSPLSWDHRHTRAAWRAHRGAMVAAANRGQALPFAILVDGDFAGQATLGGVQRGAVQGAWVGYWVDSRLHGGRVASTAVALLLAHALGPVGLHRIEATVAPENAASRAVLRRLGLREEGLLRRYLDIDGAWRDHLLYAITVEDLAGVGDPAGELLRRARRTGPVG